MRDRTPTRALENGALRYGVYAEDGSLLRYEYLALEDDPADPGTELSKATLLQDSTEVSLFGSAANRTIDEAFAGIAGQLKLIMSNMATITLTVQDAKGKPIPEVLVQGILSESGQAVYTNASGVATGYIGEGSQVIKISGYADIEDYNETLAVVKGTTITKILTLTTRNFLGITSSQSVKFSGNVDTIDYSVTSGGGGGGSGCYLGGGGGSGGDTSVQSGQSVMHNVAYPAIIGAGGFGGGISYGLTSVVSGQNPGENGGQSSFMGTSPSGGKGGKSSSTDSSGGTGGVTGGAGGTGWHSGVPQNPETSGKASTAAAYTAFGTVSNLGGGGGGGCKSRSSSEYSTDGGQIGGGRGGLGYGISKFHATSGAANTGGGGGGGGGLSDDDDDNHRGYPGGSGGSGFIGIRMHLKSAA